VQSQKDYNHISNETISKLGTLVVGVVQVGIAGLYFGYNDAVAERTDLKISEFSVYTTLGLFALAIGLLTLIRSAIEKMYGGFYSRLLGIAILVLSLFVYWRIFIENQILNEEHRLSGLLRYVSVVEIACFFLICLTLISGGIDLIRTARSTANYQNFQGTGSDN
jgi:hypothetical protein